MPDFHGRVTIAHMRKIPESELVLNPDGSIYHLALHPGQLAPTILTVGDPARVKRISRHFDTLELETRKREFLTHTGTFNGRRLSVISTGIGPDNIDIVVNEVDALFNIDLKTRMEKAEKTVLNFIRVGTSGGLQANLEPGAMVAGAYGMGLDNLFRFYEYANTPDEKEVRKALEKHFDGKGTLPVQPALFSASPELLERMGKNMRKGITVTAPGFYGPQGRHLRLASRLKAVHMQRLESFDLRGLKVLNVEMETAALYGLTRLLNHRAVSCNIILANRPAGTFTRDYGKVVDRLIEEVLDRMDF